MKKLSIDYSNVLAIKEDEIFSLQETVNKYHDMLHNATGEGNDYLGWIDLPNNYDKDELSRIRTVSQRIREDSDVLIVIGIGGSYLGAKAGTQMLNHTFYNELSKEERKGPKVYFAGQNISSTYLNELLEVINDKDISINVISKSGTTTEPALAFRILKEYMENKYGKEQAGKRIYVTTDKTRGALKTLADNEGYKTFIIPDNVGGRYSVLTPVGLLPMAVAGIDIDEMMRGAKNAFNDLSIKDIEQNSAYIYAVIRNLLYLRGKTIEILVNYEPRLTYFGEWFKQLFGESEGKEGKGIFPTSLNFTTDLHSMGQYIQDGMKNIFETTICIENISNEVEVKANKDNLDGLNYLSGKTLDYINKKAMEGTIEAHVEGGVPNIRINLPEISPYYFGYLVYFLEKACAMSGYILGVNPFNQPGVEAYKKNMFRLLRKPRIK